MGGNGTTVSGDSSNLIIAITDPDVNLNPKVKDVIGFQDNFSIPSTAEGFMGTGSSRIQIEAIDQNNVNTTLSVGGTSTVARSIMLVETGVNTGIFTATGKVYGTSSINPNVTLRGNIQVDINRDNSITPGNAGSSSSQTTPSIGDSEYPYLGVYLP